MQPPPTTPRQPMTCQSDAGMSRVSVPASAKGTVEASTSAMPASRDRPPDVAVFIRTAPGSTLFIAAPPPYLA